jgi:lysozyme
MINRFLVLLSIIGNTAIAQNKPEPEYFMGKSILSDVESGVNTPSLTCNDSIIRFYSFNGSHIKEGIKYGQYGIDISKWQGTVDWEELKSDSLPEKIHFVIAKATQGAGLVDARFSSNFISARKNGFVTGAYHFFTQLADPVAQAQNFIKTVTLTTGDFMPILDIEKNCFDNCGNTPDLLIDQKKFIENIKLFISIVEKHFNTSVVIYTGEAFYEKYLSADFKDKLFWIAKYSKTPPKCFDITGVYSIDNPCYKNIRKGCWQYSQYGKTKGIQTNVDLNFINNYYLLKWTIK